MRDGWHRTTIGEACEVVNGGTPRTNVSEYWGGDHQWITPAEMGKRPSPYIAATERTLTESGLRDSSARMLPPHSVILSSRAPIGHLVINTVPMGTNQGCKGLVPSKQLHYKFLYYYLSGIVDELNALGTGTTFKELSAGKLKQVRIPITSPSEQKRIVRVLDEAFEGIAVAKANAEKNLQNARALFESCLDGAFAHHASKWPQLALEELGTITSSKRIFKSEYTDRGVPFYRTKEVKELANGRPITTELFISESRYREIRETFGVPKSGDLLLTAIGTIGEIYVVQEGDTFYFKDGNVLWLKDFARLNSQFLKYVLLSYVEGLNKMANGAAYSALTIERLNKHQVVVPPLSDQEAIVARLDSVQAESRQLQFVYRQKLISVDKLKNSLLHQAFTGTL